MKNQNDYYYSLLKYLEGNEQGGISNILNKNSIRSKIHIFRKERELQEDKKLYRFINAYLEENNVFKG